MDAGITLHQIIVVLEVVSGIILGGGFIALYKAGAERKQIQAETLKTRQEADKVDADTAKVIGEAWAALLKQQNLDIEDLRQRVVELEGQHKADQVRIGELEEEVDELREWIEKQGLTPPPRKRR